MLARVAGNLFWLNRYLERVESTARLINEHSKMLMDLPATDPASAWYPLISITGVEDLFKQHFGHATEENVTNFLISDERNPSSVISALNAVAYNLRSSRDIMPTKLYENINHLCRTTPLKTSFNVNSGPRQEFLNDIEHQLLAISGLTEGNMSHDEGYLFLRMGCYLERADMTSRILDVQSANLLPVSDSGTLLPIENHQWMSVLKSLSAFQMYVSRVHKPVNGPDVLAYLLNDNRLPRAYRCCLSSVESCLDMLKGSDAALKLLQQLQAKVDMTQITALTNDKSQLHQYMDELQIDLARVGVAIADRYFPPPDN